MADDPVNYEVCTDAALTAAVLSEYQNGHAQLDVRRVRRVLEATFTGTCPRCQHQFSDTDRRRGLIDRFLPGRVRALGRNPESSIKSILKCSCADAHPGRPTGKFGCGFNFSLRVDV